MLIHVLRFLCFLYFLSVWKTSKRKKVAYSRFVFFMLFVLFARIKNIWGKVVYLCLVLFVLFVCVKSILKKKKKTCLDTVIYITTYEMFKIALFPTQISSNYLLFTHFSIRSASGKVQTNGNLQVIQYSC